MNNFLFPVFVLLRMLSVAFCVQSQPANGTGAEGAGDNEYV